jgi:hypothetical protein
MIDVFNSTVSDVINKYDSTYEAWIGAENFVPESQILVSEDFNCGAICNELEFARVVGDYYVESLDLELAESSELGDLINAFIDLPRRGNFEADDIFRDRFKFIVVQQVNNKRTTRWAILDALKYFVADVANDVQLIEPFDSQNLYFQIRVEASDATEDIIFLNNIESAWVDQNFLGGPSIGSIITYLGDLLNRIKAAGVDFDIIFVDQDRFTLTSDTTIGTIQAYKSVDVTIKASISTTKTINATIV